MKTFLSEKLNSFLSAGKKLCHNEEHQFYYIIEKLRKSSMGYDKVYYFSETFIDTLEKNK
jgi:hypothetical protein